MKNQILLLTLLATSLVFAQERNGLIPSSSRSVMVKLSVEEQKGKPSLQDFVESIYTNAAAILENGKSTYSSGEFPVYIFNRKTKAFKMIETKELKQYTAEQIKSFKYAKNEAEVAIFGSRIQAIGLVYLEIED